MEVSRKVVELDNHSDKLNGYLLLLGLTYSEAVKYLLAKYGPATNDYFNEKSYSRFLRGEIKSITRKKYQRTFEGLYCHHIDENKFENLSNFDYIKKYRYPFFYHKKERLVYCDLFEHLILHTLIAKETNTEFGLSGYVVFLFPTACEWYIDEKEPKPEWMKICKERSYLNPRETKILLRITDQIIEKTPRNYKKRTYSLMDLRKRLNLNMTINEYKDFQSRMKIMKKEMQTNYYKLKHKKRSIMQEMQKDLIIKKENSFYKMYPSFKHYKITINESRQSILNYLFAFKYKDIVKSKKELRSLKRDTSKYELLNELHSSLRERS